VGAVVGVLIAVPLLKEGGDFLGGQMVAGFDGRFAGDHVEELVEQVAAVGLFVAGGEEFDDLAEHFGWAEVRQHGGVAGNEDRIAAEFFDFDAELC
jgi:hypothetical protein